MIDQKHPSLVDYFQPKHTCPVKIEIQYITEAIQRQLRAPDIDIVSIDMMAKQLAGFIKIAKGNNNIRANLSRCKRSVR